MDDHFDIYVGTLVLTIRRVLDTINLTGTPEKRSSYIQLHQDICKQKVYDIATLLHDIPRRRIAEQVVDDAECHQAVLKTTEIEDKVFSSLANVLKTSQ